MLHENRAINAVFSFFSYDMTCNAFLYPIKTTSSISTVVSCFQSQLLEVIFPLALHHFLLSDTVKVFHSAAQQICIEIWPDCSRMENAKCRLKEAGSNV